MRLRFLLAMLFVATAIAPTASAGPAQSVGVVSESFTVSPEFGLASELNGPAREANEHLEPQSAQVEISIDNGSSNDSVSRPIEPIDPVTAIESVSISDGRMVLVLRSEIVQRVVLTDAGAVWRGGEVPQREYTLQPGSNRLTFPVTMVSGRYAVTIATSRVLYSTVVETDAPLIGGPFDQHDVQQAALAGLVAGVGITAVIAYKRVKGTAETPERLL